MLQGQGAKAAFAELGDRADEFAHGLLSVILEIIFLLITGITPAGYLLPLGPGSTQLEASIYVAF